VHSDPLAARKTSLKRLSAKQSCLVKYDRWAKDDERRVYTLRQTLYLCYDLLEKKAIQEAALEKQNKVPELGHTTLPDFFEDYFFRRHGVGKLAKAELRRFVHSLKHFRNADRRAELFGLLVGLIRPELFSTALGDVFMTLIKVVHRKLLTLAIFASISLPLCIFPHTYLYCKYFDCHTASVLRSTRQHLQPAQ
jgi:hypothetical protein